MSKTQRIIDRCPRFYKGWENNSLISRLIVAMSRELDDAEDSIAQLMSAHWVDTAVSTDLDKIGSIVGLKRHQDEDDNHFRSHLKRAIDDYKGGGTMTAICNELRALLAEDSFTIIENPEEESFAEFIVMANDTWTLRSSSIENESANLSLSVVGNGVISNPKLTNVDNGWSITYRGDLKTNEHLTIKKGAGFVGKQDVSNLITPIDTPLLLRKGSIWKYSEALLEGIGIFDKAKFDEQTFSIGVPNVKIRYDWIRKQPATFLVKVKPQALLDSSVTEYMIRERINDLKAAGINVIVKVME
jgi:hypothetical protein